MRRSKLLRWILVIAIIATSFTTSFTVPEVADAATKTPAKPVVTSCKATKNKVTIKWKKAKYAKAYRVYVQTGANKWKYLKKVKKTAANKKKYGNKLKYKLVVSGKKYKVYKQLNTYKVKVKKTTKRSFTLKGKYNTTYRFAIRAINGKKLSTASKIYKVKTPKKPVTPDQTTPSEDPADPGKEDPADPGTDDPSGGDQPEVKTEYTITYVLKEGVNNPANPDKYTEGSSFKLEDPTRENHSFQGWFRDSGYKNKITEITPTMKGNLTLYAKWYLTGINVNGEGMDDMIWSWWYYPQVVTEGTKTFWGYASKEGYCGVAEYDSATGKTKKTALKQALSIDDHNGLALTLLEDKRILVSYAGGHNSDYEIHIRISDKPLDISSFSTELVLESAGKTCYSQIIHANGKYYLFYRINNNGWGYRTTVDGINWTDEVMLVNTDKQYYCKVMPTTNSKLLRILMYSNPDNIYPEIRQGFLNTRNNDILDGDARTILGTSNLSHDDFQVLLQPEPGKTQRLLDVAETETGDARFLYASFTLKKGTNDAVYYLYDNGQTYKICDGGNPIWDPKYQLGAAFIGSDKIASLRHKDGFDYSEIYSFDGTQVKLDKQVRKQIVYNSIRSARPIVDVNGKAFLWHYGYYDNNSYKNFDTSAVLYRIDQDELIGAKDTDVSGLEFNITYVIGKNAVDPGNPTTYKYGDSFVLKEPTKPNHIFLGWFTDPNMTKPITEITSDMAGDLTIYAKWEITDPHINNGTMDNMIWFWWTAPHVVSDSGKVFWGYTTNDGFMGVSSYDEETEDIQRTLLEKAYTQTDARGAAVTVLKDKRVMVAYATSESAQKQIHIRISDKPLDVESFTKDVSITTPNVASFTQIVESNGTYYVFFRTNGNGSWAYVKSSDEGETWSNPIVLIAEKTMQYYCRFAPTTDPDLIRIVMQSNSDAEAPEIRTGFFNTTDDTAYDSTGVTPLGAKNVPYTKFTVVKNPAEGKTLRILDVAVTAPAEPRIAFAEFTLEKGIHDTVNYVYDKGNTYKICDGGKSLIDPKFQQGVSFSGPNRLVVARNADDTDYIETYLFDGYQVEFESELYRQAASTASRAARPVADDNGRAILWITGKYSSQSSFNTSGIIYLTESHKYIGSNFQ